MEFVLQHPDTGIKRLLVLFDGVPYEADSTHPWWDEIIDLVLEDDPRVLELISLHAPQEELPTIPDEQAAGEALMAYFDAQGINPYELTEYTPENLRVMRDIFDRTGFPRCDSPHCPLCNEPDS